MADEHLDNALAEQFAGRADVIHRLKTTDAHFRHLLERNHVLWREIQDIHADVEAADDDRRRDLEKDRLRVLDEIAARIAEAG